VLYRFAPLVFQPAAALAAAAAAPVTTMLLLPHTAPHTQWELSLHPNKHLSTPPGHRHSRKCRPACPASSGLGRSAASLGRAPLCCL